MRPLPGGRPRKEKRSGDESDTLGKSKQRKRKDKTR